ncbi:hypothetical protein E2C01_047241 [Portunus trituberculatus]|uniref:Uncharacterized protein n=1 Tax=Portunus trituberculatus TaxID=210409 RepID=A0A5B7G342_PORTR|nr:hypothetical protein [Portunus trituberculatus]
MHHQRPIMPRPGSGQSPFRDFDSISQVARRPQDPAAHAERVKVSGGKTAKAKVKAKTKPKKSSSRQTTASAWQYTMVPTGTPAASQASASFPDPAHVPQHTSSATPKSLQDSLQQDGMGRRRREHQQQQQQRPLTSWRSLSALQGESSAEKMRPRHWSPSPERRKSVSFEEPQVILRYSPEDPRESPRPKGLVNKALMKSWTKGFTKRAAASGGGSEAQGGVGASPLPFLKKTKSGQATPEAGSVSSVPFSKKKKTLLDKERDRDRDKEGSVRSGGSHLSDHLGKLKANLHLRRSHAAAEPVMTGFVQDSSEFLSPKSPTGEGDTISLASYTSIESSASAAAAAARHRPTKHWKKKKHQQEALALGPADLRLRPTKAGKAPGPVRAFRNMLGKNSRSTMDLSVLERASVTGMSRSYDDILKENNFPTQQEFASDARMLTLSRDCVEPGDFDDDAEYYRDFHRYYDSEAQAEGSAAPGNAAPQAAGKEASSSPPPAVESSVRSMVSKYERLSPAEHPARPRAATAASFPTPAAVPSAHHRARATTSVPPSGTHSTAATDTTTTTTTTTVTVHQEEEPRGGVAATGAAMGKQPKPTPRNLQAGGEGGKAARAVQTSITRTELLPATPLRPAVRSVEKNTTTNDYENLIMPPRAARSERLSATHARDTRHASASPPSSPPPPPPREAPTLEKNHRTAVDRDRSRSTENGRCDVTATHAKCLRTPPGLATTTTTTTTTSVKKTEGPAVGLCIPAVVVTEEDKTRVSSAPEAAGTVRVTQTQTEARQDAPSHRPAQQSLSGSSNEDSGFLSSLHRLVRKTTSSSSTEDPQPSLKERLAKRLSSVSSDDRDSGDSRKRKVPPERPPPPKLVCDKFNTYGHYLSADDPPLVPPSPPPPKPPRLFQILSGYRRPGGDAERLAGGSDPLLPHHHHHNYRRYSLLSPPCPRRPPSISPPPPPPPTTPPPPPPHSSSEEEEEEEEHKKRSKRKKKHGEDKVDSFTSDFPLPVSHDLATTPASEYDACGTCSGHSSWSFGTDEQYEKAAREEHDHDHCPVHAPVKAVEVVEVRPESPPEKTNLTLSTKSTTTTTNTSTTTCPVHPQGTGEESQKKTVEEKVDAMETRLRSPPRRTTLSTSTMTTTRTQETHRESPKPRERRQAVLTRQLATRETSPTETQDHGDTEEHKSHDKDPACPVVTKRTHYTYEKHVKATPRRGEGRLSGLAAKQNYKSLSRSLEDSLASECLKDGNTTTPTRLSKYKWKSMDLKDDGDTEGTQTKGKGQVVEDDFVEKLLKRAAEMKASTAEAMKKTLEEEEEEEKEHPSSSTSTTTTTTRTSSTTRPDPVPRVTARTVPSPVALPRCDYKPFPAPRVTKPVSAPPSRPSSALSSASDRSLVNVFFEKLLESQQRPRTSTPRLAKTLSRSETHLARHKDPARQTDDPSSVEDVRTWKMRTSLDSSTLSDSPSACESYKSEPYISYHRQMTSPTTTRPDNDLRRSVSCDRIPPTLASFPDSLPRPRPRLQPPFARSDALVFSSDEDMQWGQVSGAQGGGGVRVRRISDSILSRPEGSAGAPPGNKDAGYTGDTEDEEVGM